MIMKQIPRLLSLHKEQFFVCFYVYERLVAVTKSRSCCFQRLSIPNSHLNNVS